jgi:hypothetical protein
VTPIGYIVLVQHGEVIDLPDAVGGFDDRAAAVAWVTSARDDGLLTEEHETQILPVFDHDAYQL